MEITALRPRRQLNFVHNSLIVRLGHHEKSRFHKVGNELSSFRLCIGKQGVAPVNKYLVAILVISILGNMLGMFFLYKYMKSQRQLSRANQQVTETTTAVDDLTGLLDGFYKKRMIFLHHSVGHGILYQGGLRDSLLEMGILVKGATYGDEIGQQTDMCDWLPKFQKDMNRILTFKAHPDKYYQDSTTNDLVMFKSCFPNSDIVAPGSDPGDPTAREKTIANYKAAFNGLKVELTRHSKTLFVYLTAPPLAPDAGTSVEAARRAREFNHWLIGDFLPAYKQESGLNNLVIFDLFDILADPDNFLRKEYRIGPGDSHPNKVGNQEVARRFMDFFRPVWTAWESQTTGAMVNR